MLGNPRQKAGGFPLMKKPAVNLPEGEVYGGFLYANIALLDDRMLITSSLKFVVCRCLAQPRASLLLFEKKVGDDPGRYGKFLANLVGRLLFFHGYPSFMVI